MINYKIPGLALFLLTLIAVPASAADNDELLQQLADRAAIREVANHYIQALDTRDPVLYLSVFTEDAEYDIEGTVYRGHEQLGGIITSLQESRAAAIAEGRPVVDLYHSNINPSIEVTSANTATYQAYWQTLRLADDNTMRIGGMGGIKDDLVKEDGVWRIKKRVLTNFVPRNW